MDNELKFISFIIHINNIYTKMPNNRFNIGGLSPQYFVNHNERFAIP